MKGAEMLGVGVVGVREVVGQVPHHDCLVVGLGLV